VSSNNKLFVKRFLGAISITLKEDKSSTPLRQIHMLIQEIALKSELVLSAAHAYN
jgi:hypothetical protein